jgi:hypothetical protein
VRRTAHSVLPNGRFERRRPVRWPVALGTAPAPHGLLTAFTGGRRRWDWASSNGVAEGPRRPRWPVGLAERDTALDGGDDAKGGLDAVSLSTSPTPCSTSKQSSRQRRPTTTGSASGSATTAGRSEPYAAAAVLARVRWPSAVETAATAVERCRPGARRLRRRSDRSRSSFGRCCRGVSALGGATASFGVGDGGQPMTWPSTQRSRAGTSSRTRTPALPSAWMATLNAGAVSPAWSAASQ